jgi:tRNA(Ile)-lysidine synthase
VLYIEHKDIDNIETLIQPENVALLDADTLREPLVLRKWSEGDRFIPLGMTHEKKVSDYLIDIKMSMAEKGRQFVLTSDGQIVWLVGQRIDERNRITKQTENVLKITKEII